MFKTLYETTEATVTVEIDGKSRRVPGGMSVAAATLVHGVGYCRTTPVSQAPRAPYCMMGVCFECLMEIDGVANRQACMIVVADGMTIRRQAGAAPVTRGGGHDDGPS